MGVLAYLLQNNNAIPLLEPSSTLAETTLLSYDHHGYGQSFPIQRGRHHRRHYLDCQLVRDNVSTRSYVSIIIWLSFYSWPY